jgi:hypothetical protein
MPASSGWPIRANMWSFSCSTTHTTTPPTSSALRMAFTSSPTLCMENMRPKPLSGSSREHPESAGAGGQDHEGHQLARLRNVAFLARLFEPARGRRFGSFEVAFFSHGGSHTYRQLLPPAPPENP